MKCLILIFNLFICLSLFAQKESISFRVVSEEPTNEYNYVIQFTKSDSLPNIPKLETDTIINLSSEDFDLLRVMTIFLNPDFTTSPEAIINSKKFIEININALEINDTTKYINFENSNEKLFSILNIMNIQKPNQENNCFEKNILNKFHLNFEYKLWLNEYYKCINIIIDARIFPENHVNIHQLDIFNNNDGIFLAEWRFSSSNCRNYAPDPKSPIYWNLASPCPMTISSINALDSLLKSSDFSFLDSTIKKMNESYISIDFFERGKFLYTKYYNFQTYDNNLFRLIYLIEKLEGENDTYGVDWFFNYLNVEENYKKWKKENKP